MSGTTSAPGFWQVGLRWRYVGLLALMIVVAAVFAALGHWQFERSLMDVRTEEPPTETVMPLVDVAEPNRGTTTTAEAQMVSVEISEFVADDWMIRTGRVNDDAPGAWVLGHALDVDGTSLAVAVGWAPDAEAAAAAIEELRANPPAAGEVIGRYLPTESPQQSAYRAGEETAVAVAQLVNEWSGLVEPSGASTGPGSVWGGYLVTQTPVAGLAAIDSPPPIPQDQVNLMNLFYALEWVIFGGFALFLWWRVVKDQVLREAAAEQAAPSATV